MAAGASRGPCLASLRGRGKREPLTEPVYGNEMLFVPPADTRGETRAMAIRGGNTRRGREREPSARLPYRLALPPAVCLSSRPDGTASRGTDETMS